LAAANTACPLRSGTHAANALPVHPRQLGLFNRLVRPTSFAPSKGGVRHAFRWANSDVIRIVSIADPASCELSGSPDELTTVARRIDDWVKSGAARLEIAAETEFDPASYDTALGRFVLRRNSGPILLAVDSGALVADGSTEAFAQFTPWFEFPPETSVGSHVHFDNAWGNDYIHDSTVPLVIFCDAV